MKGIAGCINILGARAWRMCVLKLDKEEAEARGGGKSSPDPGEGEPLWAVAANALCSEGSSEPTTALCTPCIYTLTSRLVVKNIRSPHRKLGEPCALSLCITSFTLWRSDVQLDLPFLILITSLSTWCYLLHYALSSIYQKDLAQAPNRRQFLIQGSCLNQKWYFQMLQYKSSLPRHFIKLYQRANTLSIIQSK